MIRSVFIAAGLVLSAGAAMPASAQVPTFRPSEAMVAHRVTLVSQAATPSGERAVLLPSRRGQRHQGTVLMIVGAAGIVTGLIVDEPIVTIAGAVVGGIGLYMFLDSGGQVRVGGQSAIPF